MRSILNVEIFGAKQRVARISDDDRIRIEEGIDLVKQRSDGHRFVVGCKRARGSGVRESGKRTL